MLMMFPPTAGMEHLLFATVKSDKGPEKLQKKTKTKFISIHCEDYIKNNTLLCLEQNTTKRNDKNTQSVLWMLYLECLCSAQLAK